MKERTTLMAVLVALYLGSRLPADVGAGAFYAALGIGWVVVIVWTLLAWRSGEKIFVWQNRGG